MAKSRGGWAPVVIRVPETRAAWFQSQGWQVIARDSEVPAPVERPAMDVRLLTSNPRRIADVGDDT